MCIYIYRCLCSYHLVSIQPGSYSTHQNPSHTRVFTCHRPKKNGDLHGAPAICGGEAGQQTSHLLWRPGAALLRPGPGEAMKLLGKSREMLINATFIHTYS